MAGVPSSMMLLLFLPVCSCLRKSKLRQTRQQPYTPPTEIFDQVELTNEFQLGEQCNGNNWITDLAGTALSDKRYGACALVGTGSALAGKANGPLIDSYDTVIRVSRIPRTAGSSDAVEFGTRTDVLFSGPRLDGRDSWSPEGLAVLSTGESEPHQCAHDHGRCPVDAVVLNTGALDAKKRLADVYPSVKPGVTPESSIVPLARQSETVRWAMKHLEGLALNGKQSTPNLQAFFTFMPLCDMITLFGFQGAGSAEGHAPSGVHNMSAEHELLRATADGQLPSQYLGLRDPPAPLRRIEECLLPHFDSNTRMVLLHDDDDVN